MGLWADLGRQEESWSELLNICSALVTLTETVHRILHLSAGGVIWLSPKLTHTHPLLKHTISAESHPDSHNSLLSYIKHWDF